MSKYIATIGVDYGVKPVKVEGADVRVNFWDLSGTPFSILWFMLHCCLLAYALYANRSGRIL